MRTDQQQPKPRPGDEARPGTKIDGKPCENCAGTGKIIRGIGGA